MKSLVAALLTLLISSVYCKKLNNSKHDDDYYLNYDYDNNNNSSNMEVKPDSLILPDPRTIESKYTVDVLPNIELPEDSLADSDLKDHDFIDNIMYVYYGSNNRNERSYGSQVIIVGSVLSCAAQLLTIFCVLLKKYYKGRRSTMMYIVGNVFGSMFISNLIFMLGVYANRSLLKCLIIALLLNFLHHHTAIWIFVYCFYIYRRFCRRWIFVYFKMMHLNVVTYGLPLIITLTSYFFIPNSYETKKYCFISIHRGMIVNYMVPVCILLILTTVYTISGMIKINIELSKLDFHSSAESLHAIKHEMENMKDNITLDEEIASLRETRSCLKSLCIMQLAFAIYWFTTTIALDAYDNSKELPYLQLLTSVVMNWFIFIKRKSFVPTMEYTLACERNLERSELLVSNASTTRMSNATSSDNIPLLNSENATEMKDLCSLNEGKELPFDYNNISTIST